MVGRGLSTTRRGRCPLGVAITKPLSIARNILEDFVQGDVADLTKKRGRGRSRGGGKGRGQPTGGRGGRGRGQLSMSAAETPSEVEEEVEVEEREVEVEEEVENEDEDEDEDEGEGEDEGEMERDMEDGEDEGEMERDMEDGEGPEGEEGEGHGGEEGTSKRKGYLRGASKLPTKPTNLEERPKVKPYGDKSWEEIGLPGKECAPANGILGRLLKKHYPGLVKLRANNHEEMPASTWNHYKAKKDDNGVTFADKVKDEFWEFYKCEDGYWDQSQCVLDNACKKLVQDMIYELRVQRVTNYYFEYEKIKLIKKDARGKTLTREQYMKVPPRWVVNEGRCWEKMVDKWCTDDWKAKHEERQLRRAAMIRVSHHQGSRNLLGFKKAVSERIGEPVSEYQSYALSHKAKASVVTPYNDSDPAEVYTSLTSYRNMTEYKTHFKAKHGADSDPSVQPLDPEMVMVAGGGKKNGQFCMAGSLISTANVRTLPQIKARRTSSSPAIRPRSTPIQLEIEARLAEERRLADKRMEEALAEKERQMQAKFAEERRHTQSEMHQFLAAYCAANSFPPPPPPPTRSPNTPEGGASNDPRSSHASGNNPLGSSPMF